MHAATWWIDRWRKSTAYTDMTLAEQGAYRNLLDELWLREGALPDDDRILGRISGDPVEWPRVREKVLSRFRKTPEGWVNDTQAEVLLVARNRANAASDRGRNAAAVRWADNSPGKSPGNLMLEHVPKDMHEVYPPVSGLHEKMISLAVSPGAPGDGKNGSNEISLLELNEISLSVVESWGRAADWVREHHPRGRRWATHRTLPQKARGPLCEHVRRLGREEFLAQFSKLLRWAVHQPFWTELRYDGHASDSWVPTIISILAADKWDERVDVAAAATENHRTLVEEADAEDERDRKANEELAKILAAEREKIDRADKAAGGSVNLRFATDEPIDDPELISVTEAAEELIRSRKNGAAS